eukprot:jgi/Botrbrau1/4072/Bobra.152_3s0027.1
MFTRPMSLASLTHTNFVNSFWSKKKLVFPRAVVVKVSSLFGPSELLRFMSRQHGKEVPFVIPANFNKWWTPETVAVVTGANKGIGYDIARIIAENGLKTVVTSRNEALGEEAAASIKARTGSDNVLYHQLDISDGASVKAFAQWASKHASPINILINNAGMAYKGNVFGAEEAATTLGTNFEGTREVCEALLPYIADGGRIVNVCSRAGKLSIVKAEGLRSRFEQARSADDVSSLAREFVDDIKGNRHQDKGWPATMYGVSKLCEATYTRILAADVSSRNISVNACCPGYVKTDMSSGRGIKDPSEGADTPVWLALLAPPSMTGGFYSERTQEPF